MSRRYSMVSIFQRYTRMQPSIPVSAIYHDAFSVRTLLIKPEKKEAEKLRKRDSIEMKIESKQKKEKKVDKSYPRVYYKKRGLNEKDRLLTGQYI